MKRKIIACILTAVLGITTIPLPTGIMAASYGKSTAEMKEPLEEIRTQESVMEQQEALEEEENMPAEEPDPLVLDKGRAVPASTASWTEDEPGNTGTEERKDAAEREGTESSGDTAETESAQGAAIGEDFSDGTSGETVKMPDDSTEPAEDEMEISENISDTGNDKTEELDPDTLNEETPETTAEAFSAEMEMQGSQEQPDTEAVAQQEDGSTDSDGNEAGEIQDEDEAEEFPDLQTETEDSTSEDTTTDFADLTEESLVDDTTESSTGSTEEFSAGEETEDFSPGDASEENLRTYRTVTLKIKNGQDITAPLNTLFLKLKDKATDETPYKIIIPAGSYVLTGTLCMYSNMYLYARGATIKKTSTTKHLILRLGDTKESAGGYNGYRNIVIDGGTWNYNYQCVAEKDEPGGFVGFCIGHAKNVTIKNATFLNNLKSHFLEFGGVKNAKITGCTFRGYYKNYVKGGQECIQIDCCTDEGNVFPQYKPYDGSTCEDFVIDGNVFEDVFAGVGTHSMMAGKTYKRITVTNNTFRNVKKRCIEFLNYEDSVAENNTMINVGIGVDVSAVNKKNTHRTSGYNGGPDTKKNRNIRVVGNHISLSKTTSIGGIEWICSGINVTGYHMKSTGGVIPKGIYPVKGVTVENNQISGYGNGISVALADTTTVADNQVRMKKTSVYSNLGIYSGDSRGSIVQKNTVSGTANTGIYLYDETYAAGSAQGDQVSTNTVSAVGGDGIYLQALRNISIAEKNTVKSAGGSGLHLRSGRNISVSENTCSSNKDHGIRVEYGAGGTQVRNNRVLSNEKSGIMLWKAKVREVSGNSVSLNRGNGIYMYRATVPAIKNNMFSGNGRLQALYAKDSAGRTSMNKPVCRQITARSTAVTGTAAGSQNITVYVQEQGKLTKLGSASVNKKKQFTVKIKKQKQNTVLKITAKDKYGNTVSTKSTVK